MSRRRGSLAASPLLIGALTTLIAAVAVYISYNANHGLPFTPTYDINVTLPEASGLQSGNEVRIAGKRVGVVNSLSPYQDPATGRVTAIAHLKLEKKVESLPADSTVIVQSVSTIGLKYLALEKGTSTQILKPGATLSLSHSREPVDIDEFFNMFNAKTRTAQQHNLIDFGDGFAGRGVGLNNTIATLRPLVTNAIPVLRNLASPQTDFHELWVALERVSAETAPVAEANAQGWVDMDTFFTAWAAAAHSLEQTIEGGAPSLQQAIYSLPFEATFQRKSTEFMRLLRPSAAALRTAAAPLGHAIAAGAVNLRAATSLNTHLADSAQAYQAFIENPVVPLSLEELTQTTQLGNPLLAGIAPAQATCNYITLAFRNLASAFSENIGIGTLLRTALVLAPNGANNEGYPASAPANGPSVDLNPNGKPVDDNHLHTNPYPNVAGPGQPRECEAANEPYIPGQAVIGKVPSKVGTNREATKRTEGLFGETYPRATLEALGLSTSKQTSKGASK